MLRNSRFQYEQIAETLSQRIAAGTYEDSGKLPSETLLAEEFGVNRLTLRKALGLLQDADLIRREKGRGTFVNPQSASRHRSHLATGFLYVGDYESHFWRELYLAIAAEAQRLQCPVSAFNPAREASPDAMQRRLRSLLQQDYRVIVSGFAWSVVAPLLDPRRSPPVRVHIMADDSDDPGYAVLGDQIRAGETATRQLLKQGHRRIAFLGARAAWGDSSDYPAVAADNEAYQGYCLALNRAGIHDHRAMGYSGDHRAAEDQALGFLRALDGWPSAVVCDTDFRAGHVYQAARTLGLRIPDDLSVIGMGDTLWCEMLRPCLSSVSYDQAEMARLAVALCDTPAASRPTRQHVAPRLVQRDSSAPPDA